MNVNLRVFHGPNVNTPFAAAVAEFDPAFTNQVLPSVIESRWLEIDETQLWQHAPPSHALDFPELVLQIAIKLQHPNDPEHARILIKRSAEKVSIFLGLIDYQASLQVLKYAIFFAEHIFQADATNTPPLHQHKPVLRNLQRRLGQWLPQHPITHTLMHEAHRRSIPVFPVAPYSQIWLFGQGAAGRQYFLSANERDSFTGMKLQRDKTQSNALVKRLGFPGVRHAVAISQQEAQTIAGTIGYPVVVKPIASGMGNGVSAFITNDEDLGQAFSKARSVSQDPIIVEGHIAGNDHRLAVFGGKVAWVAARYPASVVGDGTSSISELIAVENSRRKEDPSAADGGLKQIVIDQDLIRHLNKQGLTLESRPAQGSTTYLRSIANISKGGAIADVTELTHPDNIEMAEAIARSFRMDTMGIDFMTPDIARSWREVPSAVIEVNGTPGIFFDKRAARILDAGFKAGSNGRIPSVILISPPPGYTERTCRLLGEHKLCVGLASGTSTQLRGRLRGQTSDPLHVRIGALLADPDCEAIVIETTAELLLDKGLPLDRADITIAFAPLTEELTALTSRHSSKFITETNEQVRLDEIITEVAKRYADNTVRG